MFWKEISPAKIVQYTPKNISRYHFSTKMLLFVPNKWTKTELLGKRRSSKAASKGCNSYTEYRISLKFRTQFIFQSIINIFGYWTSKLSIFVFKSEKRCRKIREKRPFLIYANLTVLLGGKNCLSSLVLILTEIWTIKLYQKHHMRPVILLLTD